mmetsp:Transcript_25397/g.36242  ORF Transcript_25397/g.36242 Transcript_25397/m.36242 type:complete len:476 (+) Transcript_25397:163-1590(+)|eukprot:CAMPEP_0201698768 /NCGR_PEP_ID=MMETSP0578-20130828/20713_1 /ASSEMBLY_ACC=CAM_ASM_000663 /TAXON_ID=267565 /ORGANISM="Skeletonema grethea, Strain CCMP 1804" /LENGTH=475 /DNA_ID=CAMNT_0048185383 /DNA_START=50 /DNA_END=1477 /DNA_ORIENTATION=+
MLSPHPESVISSSATFSPIIPDQDNDDEDPIIRSIDVFISPELSRTLHLLQFPIQPVNTPSSNNKYTPIEAKVRPKHNMLELEYPIPNAALGGQSNPQAGHKHLTQRTFTSNAIAPVTHMALAKLDKAGERLDIIPLQKSVMQMRPSFDHLHNHDEEDDAQQNTNLDKSGDTTTTSSSSSGGKQKPILFQKKESDRSATARRNSYAHKRASEESEEWIELDVHGSEGKWSSVRKDMMRKVECANRDVTIQLAAKSKFTDRDEGHYVRSLNYMESISAAFADTSVMEESSLTTFSNTNAGEDVDETAVAELASKLVILLQEGLGKMIPFSVLRSNFHLEKVSDELLIMALSSCAVLVRGNFALKSSLAQFLKKDVMKELRDLMLLLLNMHGSIQRERLVQAFETKASTNDDYAVINADVITFVLETMAKLSNGCWVPKVEDDVVFAARFPKFATCHGVYWVKKKEMLKELVELYEQ